MSGTPRLTRRRLLVLLAAAPIALAVAPTVAVVAPDPVDAAVAELVEMTVLTERVERRTGDGSALLLFARATTSLRTGLIAAHGEDVGGRIWRAAMRRHHRWLGERYGLDGP